MGLDWKDAKSAVIVGYHTKWRTLIAQCSRGNI